jgi:hypothetical protein
MPEGRHLCGVEVAGGRAGKAVERRLIYGSGREPTCTRNLILTKWTLVMAMKIRHFDRLKREPKGTRRSSAVSAPQCHSAPCEVVHKLWRRNRLSAPTADARLAHICEQSRLKERSASGVQPMTPNPTWYNNATGKRRLKPRNKTRPCVPDLCIDCASCN